MKFRALLICLFLLAGLQIPVQARPLAQNSNLALVAPSACPPGGCAAGQRLSYLLTYDVGVYDKALAPNLMVCVYLPTGWKNLVEMDAAGGITQATYEVPNPETCAPDASPPFGYEILAVRTASLQNNYFNDTLGLSFRISPAATGSGSLLMRVFEQTASGWQRTTQVFTPQIKVAPRATTAYLASSPSACSASPCYLNSAGDQARGLGTGLRDALDAFDPAASGLKVVVLGTVFLRSNPVAVDKPVSIEGVSNSTLTIEAGSACVAANPLLQFTAGGAVRLLNLNGGPCASSAPRPLIAMNSPAEVLIESNDLTGGSNAIQVTGNTGGLTVRYNHITANTGYALFWDKTASSAPLSMVANNLYQNRAGDQVECSEGASGANPNRRADHNYWGSPSGADPAATHCTLGTAKQLGAPVNTLPNAPGVDAARVSVTLNKTYAFNNQIAFQRTGSGNDFNLYIVNHGASSPGSIPFAGTFAMINPCSNAWDVFLAEGAAPGGTLDLSFRYDRSAACTAAVEMTTFCSQTTNPQNYPLWWYDPRGQITAGWDTTGQNPAGSGANGVSGQTTSCDLNLNEIKVSIDSSGRPDLADDLNFTPFLVGMPVTSTFAGLASNQTASLYWTTVSEPDVTGFVVMRSAQSGGPFDPISDVIARKGTATTGASYAYYDTGRTNGTALYYRLQLVRSDGGLLYSDIVTVTPNQPTPTSTWTLIPTWTPYPSWTPYRYPTTAVPSATRALSPTASATFNPLLATLFPGTATLTPAPGTVYPTDSGYLAPGESSASPLPGDTLMVSGTPETVTPLAMGSPTVTQTPTRTPVPTISRAEQIRGASKYISMVMGLLVGGLVVFGFGWLIYRRRKP